MKILILVDVLNNWALHNRAKAIKKFLPEHDVTIRAALAQGEDCLTDHLAFDVIHFNFTWGITAFTEFIIKHKEKCLFTVVNERSLLFGIGVKPVELRRIIQETRFRTAVNTNMAKLCNAVYIPNGIDPDFFNDWKKPIVGYSGTDTENKNLALVRQACKDLGLELRDALYRCHAGGRTPDFPHERMKEFYKSIDVFVHAGQTEGFSNTVLEAAACNVPILMTKQGAWDEFDGWVDFIDPDVESIKRGLRKYTARRLVEDKFLWSKVVPQYDKIYKEIYDNRQRIPS
jgi:glycosyltransferase involved in cell wall biosynthesis